MSQDQKPVMIGIVVRKDGTVPFDADVHPDVKAHILAHLVGRGHHVVFHAETGTHHIKDWTPGKEI